MNNFPAMTEEQCAELVQFNRAIIAQHEAYAVSEAGWPDDVRLLVSSARIALAALTAETDYVRYSCGCCGYESLSYKHICPKCNHHTLQADKLYTAPPAPVLRVQDGWKLVPIEPTEDMVIRGFESAPDEVLSDADVWEAFNAMSGCQQAAHKARLCYAAMLAAVPEA